MLGLFDSGSGGLSVLVALRQRAPTADVHYFGDIAHAPYGVRSPEELVTLTKAGVAVLKRMGAEEIVSACNSVSPAVLSGAAGDVPAIEMTRPTARGMREYADKRVLLIATPATAASLIYERALTGMVLDSLPIPPLAGAIEFGASDSEIAEITRAAFASRRGEHYDALLFGCTHYPLARHVIEREARRMFGNVTCIDPAQFVAQDVVERFHCEGAGSTRFAISQDSPEFRARIGQMFPSGNYSVEVI